MSSIGYGYDLHNFADRIGSIITRGMTRLRIDMQSKEAERQTEQQQCDRRKLTDPDEIADSIAARVNVASFVHCKPRKIHHGGGVWYASVYCRTPNSRKTSTYSCKTTDLSTAEAICQRITSTLAHRK